MFIRRAILFVLLSSVLGWPVEKTAVANKANLPSEAAIDAKDETGLTALMQAAWDGNSGQVKNLLRSGADPKVADRYGWTALNYAITMGHADVTKALITGGAQVNTRDRREMTPLMWAALGKKSDVVTALLTGGAEVNATTKNGATAYSFALAKSNSGITKVLRPAGGAGPQLAEADLPEVVAPVDREPKMLNGPEVSRAVFLEAVKSKPMGTISLRLQIGIDGQVKQVKVIKRMSDRLTEAAVRIAFGARATPAEIGGKPVEYWYALRFRMG